MNSAHDRYVAALPEDWPRKDLGRICTQIVSGGTPSRSNSAYWDGSVPWVTPGELTNLRTKYLSSTEERITDLGLASSGATLVPRDSLLVTTRATLGSVALAAMPLATNQGFKTAVLGPEVDAAFGYHLFHRLKPELTRRASGTTFLEISGSQFAQIVVPVPTLPEQRCIASILDAVDDAIRSTEHLIQKLEKVKQGLLHDLMTRGIDENGSLRDPVVRPDLFVHTPIGTTPATWRVLSCQDATSAPIGYGIVQAGRYVPGGVFVLMIRDLDGDFRTGLHRTSPSIDTAYARSRVGPGDVLLSVKATIGRVAVVPDWYEGNISRDMARLRPGPECRPGYLRLLLSSELGERILQQTIVGTTRAEVSIGVLRRVLIPLPPPDEQDRIVAACEAIESQINADAAELSKLRLLKAGLMDDVLTGRVRVNLDEEAA